MDYTDCAFEEDAISTADAWGASERFVGFRTMTGMAFRLHTDEDLTKARLLSRDEVLQFLEDWLESGAKVEIA